LPLMNARTAACSASSPQTGLSLPIGRYTVVGHEAAAARTLATVRRRGGDDVLLSRHFRRAAE
jgi:hypothetical protein